MSTAAPGPDRPGHRAAARCPPAACWRPASSAVPTPPPAGVVSPGAQTARPTRTPSSRQAAAAARQPPGPPAAPRDVLAARAVGDRRHRPRPAERVAPARPARTGSAVPSSRPRPRSAPTPAGRARPGGHHAYPPARGAGCAPGRARRPPRSTPDRRPRGRGRPGRHRGRRGRSRRARRRSRGSSVASFPSVAQVPSQPEQAPPHVALDRAERQVEPVRDVLLCSVLDVRQMENRATRFGELARTPPAAGPRRRARSAAFVPSTSDPGTACWRRPSGRCGWPGRGGRTRRPPDAARCRSARPAGPTRTVGGCRGSATPTTNTCCVTSSASVRLPRERAAMPMTRGPHSR